LLEFIFFSEVGSTGEIICSMTGKFFISISFVMIYLFTGDFFPTLVRNQAYGAASFSGRIGGIVTPYFLYLGRSNFESFSWCTCKHIVSFPERLEKAVTAIWRCSTLSKSR